MPAPDAPALPPGFSLVRTLASSDRGLVVEVRDDEQRRLVLRILAEPGVQLGLEADVCTRVGHQGLIAPSAWGQLDDQRAWIARPWVDGRPLDAALADADEAQAVAWIATLLQALGALHDAGLLHRDVKADNVLVDDDGPWLVDLDLLSDHTARAAGSPQHLAPELLAGQPNSPATDLFALGATLAFACCGAPAPDMALRFPRLDFWAASGLDAARLPARLSRLVRALVRRHPADRPASAAAAAVLLDADGAGAPPSTEPPFLLGRQPALRQLVEDLSGDAPAGPVLLVEVEAGDEVDALVEALALALAAAGIPTAAEHGDRACRVDAVRSPDAAAADLAELLTWPTRPGHVLVGTRDGASAIIDALRGRGMDVEAAELRRVGWPALSRSAIERHLLDLSAASNPAFAGELAGALQRRSGGSHPRLARLLARAASLGVLRRDGTGWTLLRGDWPQDGDDAPDLDGLGDAAGALLDALVVVADDALPAWPLALRLTGLDLDAARAALAELMAHGLVESTPRGPRALPALAHDRLPRARLDPARRRALELLRADGAPAEVCARHELALSETPRDIMAALAGWDAAFAAGRLTRLRALLDQARAHPAADDGVRDACALRLARLELAHGHATRGWDAIESASGDAQASPELLLVAAHAAEQSGRRDAARALHRRVLDRTAERADRLRACAGLAFADVMDGAPALALEHTDDVSDDDADDAAALALSVRGVALLHLGRGDEARAVLDAAHARARRSEQPSLTARTQLNRAAGLRRAGDPREAVAALEDAEREFARAGHVHGRAQAAASLGVLQRDLGELRRARAELTRALALHRRVGDRHGAAAAQGSLAAVELEAGHVGAALEVGRRAADELARSGHHGERGFVLTQLAMASALDGLHEDAHGLLAGPDAETLAEARPTLAARARALVLALSGEEPRAVAMLREALDTATDQAERFRLAALLHVLEPGQAAAVAALHEAAGILDSDVRRAEASWRTADATDVSGLRRWLERFDEAGRTDLARVVAQHLADLHDTADRVGERREASARAAHATDALLDGVPAPRQERLLQRLGRLAGERPTPAQRGVTLDWLLACNRRLAREDDLDALLLAIVDAGLEVTRARRGFLVLVDDDHVQAHVARGMEHHDLAPEAARFSQSVVRKAVETGRPVLTSDAAADTRFSSAASIAALSLRSVLCVPLPGPGGPLGALYVDDDARREAFDERDVERLVALADQASTTVVHVRRRAEVEALNARLAERVEHQAEELERARQALRRRGETSPVAGLIGESAAMQTVYDLIDRVAPTDLSVLVTGPSGSGKNVVSRALHERSDRAAGPLIVENVAAVPATLLESELFGHARGAFTGADRDRPGLFAEADGGTFVLDEIGELPLELQPKLLRVLETGEVRPVGARRARTVDVRIVAATNRDLLECVRDGSFREDLYYRLNGVELHLPGLAERLDDIPLLVAHFLDRLGAKHDAPKSIDDAVLAALVERPWPGQVRELSNEVARLYYLSDTRIADASLVRPPGRADDDAAASASLRLEDVERETIRRALEAAGGRKDRAAQLLGISRTGLYAKLKRLEISADD